MGGLGLTTFAVLILGALGLPVGITGKLYLREDLNQSSVHQLSKLVVTILKVVVVCEVAGAMLLALTFVPQYGTWQGIWESIFHSISAFNNAGFSTFPNGLVPYATDPVVNTVIPALFIVGGIGYVVLHDIFTQKSWRVIIAYQDHADRHRRSDPVVGRHVRLSRMKHPRHAGPVRQHHGAADGQLVSGCDDAHRRVLHHRYRGAA